MDPLLTNDILFQPGRLGGTGVRLDAEVALFKWIQKKGRYVLTRTSSTEVNIIGPDGSDSLVNVEYFQFDDETANIWSLNII